MKKKKLHTETHGFKIPKNYFEDFESHMLDRMESQTPLSSVEDSGFTIPKDYFATIEDSVLSKLDKETPVFSLFNWKKVSAIASIAAVVLICASIFFNGNRQENISTDMVETYFETQDLDTYELAQLLSETEFITEDLDIVETPFEEDNLETYLLEYTDIEDIIQ